jgi:hypothetical protein
MAKKRKRYVPRGSSGALSMTAAPAPKQDPYRFIRDGKKQQVAGRANLPTARQKDIASYVLPSQDSITAIREGEAGAMDIADVALSLPGLAAVKPLVKGAKNMGVLKKVVEKGADLVGDASDYLKKGKGKGKGKGTPKSKTTSRKPTVSKTAGSERGAGDFGEKGVMKGIDKKWNEGAAKQQKAFAEQRAAQSVKKGDVIYGGAPTPQAQLPKPKPIRGTDQTSGPTIRAGKGDPSKGAIPAVRKSTTPAKTKSKTKTKSKDKDKIVGLSPLGKAVAGGTLGAGAIYGGTKLADNYYSKEAGATPKPTKKAKGSKNTVNKAPYVEGYDMDMDDFDSPKSVPSKPKAKPKAKAKKNPDFEYYGKEGTGLGDFSRKHGIQYATEEGYKKWFDTHDGEKKGGRPGKGRS